jgi:hypothetical protein
LLPRRNEDVVLLLWGAHVPFLQRREYKLGQEVRLKYLRKPLKMSNWRHCELSSRSSQLRNKSGKRVQQR